jgi:hypothetical protein
VWLGPADCDDADEDSAECVDDNDGGGYDDTLYYDDNDED